ncbi:unnamed protein product [Toxocara canis]|uniref:Protein kinase domain-containing protein n=1 Tax=Toxocara canis TaxID=6265 RepID=A0A183VFV6_TOXCA|nr:unnamed protein product [Toxocara canis]
MPPAKVTEHSKRTRNFISSKGYPRYCVVTAMPDGAVVLGGGRSRRGKPRGPPGSRTWTAALKNQGDELFIDFLKRCLEWDPDARLTPQQALKHPWLRRRLPRPPESTANLVCMEASTDAPLNEVLSQMEEWILSTRCFHTVIPRQESVAVESQWQGKQLKHIIPLITQQFRRVVQRKHVLPNYKIRHRPFFTNPLFTPSPPIGMYFVCFVHSSLSSFL